MSGFNNMQDAFRTAITEAEKKQKKKKGKEQQQLDKVAENLDNMGTTGVTSATEIADGIRKVGEERRAATESGFSQTPKNGVHPRDHKEHFERQLQSLEIPDELAETRNRVKVKVAAVKEAEKANRLVNLLGALRVEDRGKDDPGVLRAAVKRAISLRKNGIARRLWDKIERSHRAKRAAAAKKRGFRPAKPKPNPERFKKDHFLTAHENRELTEGVEFLTKKNLTRVAMTHDYWYVMVEGLSEKFKDSIGYHDVGNMTFMTRDEFYRILKEKKRLGQDIQVLPTEKLVARNYKKKGNLVGKWDEITGTGWVFRTNRAEVVVKDEYDMRRLWKEAAVKAGAKKFKVERPDVYSLVNTHEERIMVMETAKGKLDKTAVKKFVKEGGKVKTTKRQVTSELKRLAKAKRKDPKKVTKRK